MLLRAWHTKGTAATGSITVTAQTHLKCPGTAEQESALSVPQCRLLSCQSQTAAASNAGETHEQYKPLQQVSSLLLKWGLQTLVDQTPV